MHYVRLFFLSGGTSVPRLLDYTLGKCVVIRHACREAHLRVCRPTRGNVELQNEEYVPVYRSMAGISLMRGWNSKAVLPRHPSGS